jgi:hypothetical protein
MSSPFVSSMAFSKHFLAPLKHSKKPLQQLIMNNKKIAYLILCLHNLITEGSFIRSFGFSLFK